MTGNHLHLSATWVITGDTLSMAARGTRIVAEIEDRCLGTLDVARNTPGVVIEWEVHIRPPNAGQPTGSIQRLPWQPGTPLPQWTYLAQCRVTRP